MLIDAEPCDEFADGKIYIFPFSESKLLSPNEAICRFKPFMHALRSNSEAYLLLFVATISKLNYSRIFADRLFLVVLCS